jgi:fatty-acyl-CoA synthase
MDWYPKRRFGDLPAEIAGRFAQHTALVFENERYTFAEVHAQVDLAAKALMALGVKRGDHVALWLNNCPPWIFIAFGLAKIGAPLVPINTRFRTNDLEYVLRQSDSAMLIAHDVCGPIDYLGMIREVVSLPADVDGTPTSSLVNVSDAEFPALRNVLILDSTGKGPHAGTNDWDRALEKAHTIGDEALEQRAASVDPDAPALIMYTSGTTGFPKGVLHSHKLVRNNLDRVTRMGITENDIILNYLPLFHAFGYSEGALNSMLSGAMHILTETFDAGESLDIIEREGVTVVHGFEAHQKGLTEAQEAHPRNISSLRTGIFAAGMHSATPVCRRGAQALAPLKAISGFGMTEIWLGAALGSLDDNESRRFESSGYPGPGYELRVVDLETGGVLGPGDQGELQVRGYSLMLGYYKNPEETAKAYADDGWFKTGDTAVWRDDGYIRFLGRYKDMLKVGGENVDPMEVEGLLLEHPEVFQVAVVGYPDVRLAEVAVAFVQLVDGSTLKSDQVITYCRGKVASFKIPRHVIFVNEFPMTASGKIRKVELRDHALSALGEPLDTRALKE